MIEIYLKVEIVYMNFAKFYQNYKTLTRHFGIDGSAIKKCAIIRQNPNFSKNLT